MEKGKGLKISEKRCVTEDMIDIAFFNTETEKWRSLLTEILGPEVKPAGVKPTSADMKVTAGYGGIWERQTLFKKEFGDSIVIAMFWPWQTDEYTTLKINRVKKKGGI
ncbi:MAG: hypothetical protein ABIA77_06510 [Candidatus Omnitrophota bacterium]